MTRAVVGADRDGDRADDERSRDDILLLQLGELLRRAAEPGDVLRDVADALGGYLGVSRCFFVESDRLGDRVTVTHDFARDLPSLSGTYAGDALALGHREGLQAQLVAPVRRHGATVASLVVGSRTPRAWQARERELLERAADQAWTWLEHLRESAELRQSERRNAAIFESAIDAIVLMDEAGTIVDFNAAAERLFGHTRVEAVGHGLGDMVSASRRARTESPIPALEEAAHEGKVVELTVLRGPGVEVAVELTVARLAGVVPVLYVGFFRDVSDRIQREEEFRLALEASPTGMLMVDDQGEIVLVNRQVEALFGYSREELIGQHVEMLVPEVVRGRHVAYRDSFHGEARARAMGAGRDLHGVCKDGSQIPVEIGLNPLHTRRGHFVLSSIADITHRKRAETEKEQLIAQMQALNVGLEERVRVRTAELTGAVKERGVLLQEVHHRVKNNLQVISSLINLQLFQVDDPRSRGALLQCQNRVSAIALIHEKLYQSPDFSRVPFVDYATELASSIIHATGTSPDRIQLRVEMEPFSLPVDRAIPCGLILNELITNALKHAFPDDRPGTITVALRHTEEREAVLVVEDDGVGIPADFDPASSPSLGVQLVVTLVEQLRARLEFVRQHGTVVRIHFRLEGSS